ncbi:MAG: hypothetical protein JWR11_5069 [Mycobacterium sp.]|nr:hypothetical protein [Mycobacterium sp.]
MAAAGLSGALVVGHATDTTVMLQLANTVIGIGGQGDPMSAHVPAKLSHTVVPTLDNVPYTYYPVVYPATVFLDSSRDVAVPIVHAYLTSDQAKTEDHLIVAGYSLGTMAAEQEKRNLQKLDPDDAPSHAQLTFVMIGSPFAGNGGIFERFPGLGIPFITSGMGPAQPSRYDTTYSVNEYDVYADFPAYFNPVSLLNSALSIRYGHPDAYYDSIDPATSYGYLTKVDDPVTGSHDQYVLYYNPHLPLLGPLRELASLTQTSALVEPLLSAIEPVLRVMVDMSYTDRVNANPSAAVPFSLITPPQKIVEALAALPGAIAQGVTNLASGGHPAVTAPPNPLGNLVPMPTVPSTTPEVQNGQARIALAPTPQRAVPKLKLDEDPGKPGDPPTSTAPTASPVASLASADDGLHPTMTSDGNKFTPGSDGTAAQSTGKGIDAGQPVTSTTPTTTATPTATTTTTTTTTTATTTTPTTDDKTTDKTGESDTASAAA